MIRAIVTFGLAAAFPLAASAMVGSVEIFIGIIIYWCVLSLFSSRRTRPVMITIAGADSGRRFI